jgi:hypothetical protein
LLQSAALSLRRFAKGAPFSRFHWAKGGKYAVENCSHPAANSRNAVLVRKAIRKARIPDPKEDYGLQRAHSAKLLSPRPSRRIDARSRQEGTIEVMVATRAAHDPIETNFLEPGAFCRLAKMVLLVYVLKREQVVRARPDISARTSCMNIRRGGRVEKALRRSLVPFQAGT